MDGERPALEAAELRSRLHWLIQSQGLPCDPPNARQQRFFQEVADESARLERAGLPLAEQVAGVEAFLADRGALGRAEGLLGNLARGRGAS